MKLKFSLIFILMLISINCSKSIEYSEEFMGKTSGKYLYNDDNLMEVYYKDNVLFLNWKGGEVKPVVLSENEFFVPDMYQKLRFVEHPKTGKRYISIIPETEESEITYDYLKVATDFKTPTMHLKGGNYEDALEGYLAIKEKDSTSPFIDEWDINNLGYKYLRDEKFSDAIAVFELNIKLHPNSYNVFDSLANAYLKSGDSIMAFENYKKAYKSNQRNKRALRYIETYESKNTPTAQ
ncbi:tetratricopeptide repeat protein [Winogradskyella sp. DF17]|uniref:Tetratricopeptide repeat protein n=1 Tax=Winogradskyella pelagia TaxID=2819984 RepID=A0ABS3T4K5_9FLAO|nr:tetratricopeptide repeat protein [Winogradskyella sp. DF17]MBO3116665.1 tetratricopeptide repeat protein [Winogradskyella sp. DF17]